MCTTDDSTALQKAGLLEEPHDDDDEIAAAMIVSDPVVQPGAPQLVMVPSNCIWSSRSRPGFQSALFDWEGLLEPYYSQVGHRIEQWFCVRQCPGLSGDLSAVKGIDVETIYLNQACSRGRQWMKRNKAIGGMSDIFIAFHS